MTATCLARSIAILLQLTSCGAERRATEPRLTGTIVTYGQIPSGAELRGVLYRPKGSGPFPTLLYAHGSAPGAWSNEAFEAVSRSFTARGWALFAPYRRGQGLSSQAGRYLADEIAAARTAGGPAHAQARLARLLATDHMDDQQAAFAWLARQPFVDQQRIAVMGNSFGGIIALLSAQRLPVCAAIDAAGAADSWDRSPALRRLMTDAATTAPPPILLMQAANDYSLAPSRTLHAARIRARRPSELLLYPPFGDDPRDGHAFAYKGVAIWAGEVHSFVARACPVRAPLPARRTGPPR